MEKITEQIRHWACFPSSKATDFWASVTLGSSVYIMLVKVLCKVERTCMNESWYYDIDIII